MDFAEYTSPSSNRWKITKLRGRDSQPAQSASADVPWKAWEKYQHPENPAGRSRQPELRWPARDLMADKVVAAAYFPV